eukprot:m51a1_g12896 hypothetical protein (88) ;mRNA; r:53-513
MHSTNIAALLHTAEETSRFDEWAQKHHKVYTADEYPRRLDLFLQAELTVARLNADHQGRTTFALNAFADLTPDELRTSHQGRRLRRA